MLVVRRSSPDVEVSAHPCLGIQYLDVIDGSVGKVIECIINSATAMVCFGMWDIVVAYGSDVV
jgi:hypothetical protein